MFFSVRLRLYSSNWKLQTARPTASVRAPRAMTRMVILVAVVDDDDLGLYWLPPDGVVVGLHLR